MNPRKNPVLTETQPMMQERFGDAVTKNAMAYAQTRLEALCAENAGEPKAKKVHTLGMIYPGIALYEGLQTAGISKKEAFAFLDYSYSQRCKKKIASTKALMKLPGFYKLYPALFASVAKNQFGEAAGFKAKWYPTEKTRVKFDMTQCLFCDVCQKYGCPELVPVFCHTDDVNNGDLHPRLCWNRTKIMGDGADCCDFDLYVKVR